MISTVEMVSENLIECALGKKAGHRQKHLLREALRSLVRLAKAEQMLEIKINAIKLIDAPRANASQTNLLIEENDLPAYPQRSCHPGPRTQG